DNIALALLLTIGALTILFAVIMALIQHDLRKLLSYHAISQVGYMVLGFGTGVAIGIAGGIFHMLNNALYKTGLFLSAGAVGNRKKTFELSRLGSLAAYMPVTFVCALVFSLSISGVPPFNGFASKWLLYQGAIEGLFVQSSLAMRLVFGFALIAAMFGSALTLASFVKFIHAVFLGQDNSEDKGAVSEVSWKLLFPLTVLAGFCVILGILPGLFLRRFIAPWLPQEIFSIGTWNGLAGFILLALGLLLGWLLWSLFAPRNTRQDQPFLGGEEPVEGESFPATEFYRTVEDASLLKRAYAVLKIESLDLYCLLRGLLRSVGFLLFILIDRLINLLTMLVGKTAFDASWVLRRLHTGNLDQYLLWSLAGLAALFFVLMGR
ncbi:MAG: proton-conducting transporter membrane subunit, partial [Candidatus Omnitrophota bacterium]